MRILIATGIYPPEIGGPAQYAMNLMEVWKKQGHEVSVGIFSRFNFLPTGIRHFFYFFSILPKIIFADIVVVLDTYSCAFPTVLASSIFNKKVILRTGGDFLWEQYVERTGDLVLLREFYDKSMEKFSTKEKVIFGITKWILNNVNGIIWSTEWQKNIFMKPYGLQKQKHFIVENYYGPRVMSHEPIEKNFIAFTRKLKWKHTEFLKNVFGRADVKSSGAILDTSSYEHSKFLEAISRSYAVIIASLGDISPNTILDAIRCNKPFILTKETGLYDRIKEAAIFVDPKNENEIVEKVIWLSNKDNYDLQKKKVEAFTFVHTWEEIASEYIEVYNHIK